MYNSTKSSMQERLPSCQQPVMSETCWNAINVEASQILHKLSTVSVDKFYEFAVVFYNYVIRLVEGFGRLDVAFNRYFKKFKSTYQKRTRFLRYTGITHNWWCSLSTQFPSFAHKHGLGLYLALKIVSIHSDVGNTHLLCATHNTSVISFPPTVNDTVFQISSTAEEADQKIIPHCIKVRYFFTEIILYTLYTFYYTMCNYIL